jgi:hypothetical protein
VTANSLNQTLLTIIEREKAIIPVSPTAFHVAQDSEKKLNEAYRGALVISRSGDARSVERIRVIGLYGTSLLRKIRSALLGLREIKVNFKEVGMTLGEFKQLVIRYVGYDQERGEPYLPQVEPLEVVYQRVRGSSSFEEVFQSINVPEPENALDIL